MDGGAWWATVHEVADNQTRLSEHASKRIIQVSFYIVFLLTLRLVTSLIVNRIVVCDLIIGTANIHTSDKS